MSNPSTTTHYRLVQPDRQVVVPELDEHQQRVVDHPGGPLLYMISCMHCMTVSLAQGGDGLGAMWGEQKARELLAEAGFASVDVHLLDFSAQFIDSEQ